MHSRYRRDCSSSVWRSSLLSSPSSSSSRSSWSAAPRARRATSSLCTVSSAEALPRQARARQRPRREAQHGQVNDGAHGACSSDTGRRHVSAHSSVESRRHWPRPQRNGLALSLSGTGERDYIRRAQCCARGGVNGVGWLGLKRKVCLVRDPGRLGPVTEDRALQKTIYITNTAKAQSYFISGRARLTAAIDVGPARYIRRFGSSVGRFSFSPGHF